MQLNALSPVTASTSSRMVIPPPGFEPQTPAQPYQSFLDDVTGALGHTAAAVALLDLPWNSHPSGAARHLWIESAQHGIALLQQGLEREVPDRAAAYTRSAMAQLQAAVTAGASADAASVPIALEHLALATKEMNLAGWASWHMPLID